MGSNLKEDDSMSDKDKILGHQSTQSIGSYGNKTNGTGGYSAEAGEYSDDARDNKTNFDELEYNSSKMGH
ncbi:hypothetical protein SPONL_2057 [uncultured Candidatus Thioglobus sp.]|nr:hypothetical protein SPONL_2057 [uncultured Candidatus Thioglobus sp.]